MHKTSKNSQKQSHLAHKRYVVTFLPHPIPSSTLPSQPIPCRQVFYLTREAFMAVVERRKVTCPQLAQIVRKYCVKIVVTRGIIAEARIQGEIPRMG